MAKHLAESPSVNIRVHFSKSFVPAKFASSNFSIPKSLDDFFTVDERALCNFILALALPYSIILVTIFDFKISLINFSFMIHSEPKFDTLDVNVSFVCESKEGFSILQLIKTQIFCFI